MITNLRYNALQHKMTMVAIILNVAKLWSTLLIFLTLFLSMEKVLHVDTALSHVGHAGIVTQNEQSDSRLSSAYVPFADPFSFSDDSDCSMPCHTTGHAAFVVSVPTRPLLASILASVTVTFACDAYVSPSTAGPLRPPSLLRA